VLAVQACTRAPTDEQVLAAIHAAHPALDTTTVLTRVWQDGPPWFSCAEVLAKLRSPTDSEAVRDALHEWRGMLLSGWAVARDSAKGPVVDPGWCVMKLTPDSVASRPQWTPFAGPSFPTGAARRGWLVNIGRPRIVLRAPARATSRDAASVDYIVTLSPNVNGVALGARRDSIPYHADLRRMGQAWRIVAAVPDRSRTTR
jgi:hypothetical protein